MQANRLCAQTDARRVRLRTRKHHLAIAQVMAGFVLSYFMPSCHSFRQAPAIGSPLYQESWLCAARSPQLPPGPGGSGGLRLVPFVRRGLRALRGGGNEDRDDLCGEIYVNMRIRVSVQYMCVCVYKYTHI